MILQVILAELDPDRSPGYRQHPAEVGLDQYSDRITAKRCRQPPRRCPYPPLEAESHGPGAGPNGSFVNRPAPSRFYRRQHIVFVNVTAANVVQIAVVGFADQRIHRAHVFVPGLLQCPRGERLRGIPNAQGVGEAPSP